MNKKIFRKFLYALVLALAMTQIETAQAEVFSRTIPSSADPYWDVLHIITEVRDNESDYRIAEFLRNIRSPRFVSPNCVQDHLLEFRNHGEGLGFFKTLETYLGPNKTYGIIIGFSNSMEPRSPTSRRAIICALKK